MRLFSPIEVGTAVILPDYATVGFWLFCCSILQVWLGSGCVQLSSGTEA